MRGLSGSARSLWAQDDRDPGEPLDLGRGSADPIPDAVHGGKRPTFSYLRAGRLQRRRRSAPLAAISWFVVRFGEAGRGLSRAAIHSGRLGAHYRLQRALKQMDRLTIGYRAPDCGAALGSSRPVDRRRSPAPASIRRCRLIHGGRDVLAGAAGDSASASGDVSEDPAGSRSCG